MIPLKRRKCILLLPVKYNDGAEIPPDVLGNILKALDEAFDGHTVDGLCDGVYRMADGSFTSDRTLKVWVALAPERVDQLRAMAAEFAALLRQESLYFEVTEAEVEFIRPATPDSEAP